jgi:hypothetical protein
LLPHTMLDQYGERKKEYKYRLILQSNRSSTKLVHQDPFGSDNPGPGRRLTYHHLGKSSVIDASLHDIIVVITELSAAHNNAEAPDELSSSVAVTTSWTHKAGLDSEGRRTVLLQSMTLTHDIIGLAAGFLCTHRSPMWRHLSICSMGG